MILGLLRLKVFDDLSQEISDQNMTKNLTNHSKVLNSIQQVLRFDI